MLKDAKHTAELAMDILEIVCSDPANAYAYAITRTLRANRGKAFTNALDVGIMLQMLTKEGFLELIGVPSGRSRPCVMYRPTWKAFFNLSQKRRW